MRKTLGAVLLSLSLIDGVCADEMSEFQFRIGGGVLHILDHDQTGLIKLDFLFKPVTRFDLIPVFGAFTTGTKDQYYHVGLEKHFPLSHQWELYAGFAAGAYIEKDGLDLGHTLEFQSRIGVSYNLYENHAIDLEIAHISNGRISDLNPGTEFAALNYRYIW